jgi:hypothetical protein
MLGKEFGGESAAVCYRRWVQSRNRWKIAPKRMQGKGLAPFEAFRARAASGLPAGRVLAPGVSYAAPRLSRALGRLPACPHLR